MSVLYLINNPAPDTLKRCLQRLTTDDALLLLESAVTVVNSGHLLESKLTEYASEYKIYALKPDLLARGIQLPDQLDRIKCIDYDGFVTLAVEHTVSCYWK